MSDTPYQAQRRTLAELNEKQNAGTAPVTVKPVALKKKKKVSKKTSG